MFIDINDYTIEKNRIELIYMRYEPVVKSFIIVIIMYSGYEFTIGKETEEETKLYFEELKNILKKEPIQKPI